MNDLDELVLLGAIGLPIALVAAGNAYLALTRERGTPLIPRPPSLDPIDDEPATESGPSSGN